MNMQIPLENAATLLLFWEHLVGYILAFILTLKFTSMAQSFLSVRLQVGNAFIFFLVSKVYNATSPLQKRGAVGI